MAHWHKEDSSRLEAHRHKEIAADLKLQLGKLKQNIVGKRDHVAATISSFKNQLQKRTKIYKGFTIHLTCRIYHFTKQLKELDDYVTELRKIENPIYVPYIIHYRTLCSYKIKFLRSICLKLVVYKGFTIHLTKNRKIENPLGVLTE